MAVYRPKYGGPQNPARRAAMKSNRVRRHSRNHNFLRPGSLIRSPFMILIRLRGACWPSSPAPQFCGTGGKSSFR